MKKSVIFAFLLFALLAPVLCTGQAMPRMVSVEPGSAKAGDVLSVAGENLEKSNVAEVYLTDGKNDIKVSVSEQTATAIKFAVPQSVKAGRFSLMILTSGKEPKLIEQPVKVTIE